MNFVAVRRRRCFSSSTFFFSTLGRLWWLWFHLCWIGGLLAYAVDLVAIVPNPGFLLLSLKPSLRACSIRGTLRSINSHRLSVCLGNQFVSLSVSSNRLCLSRVGTKLSEQSLLLVS